jgi:hypothetical protein
MSGRWPTVEELDGRLRSLHRSDVVLRLAWCNAFIQGWKRISSNEADQQIRRAWFPAWEERFRHWSIRYGEGFLFARHTILWLMKRAFVMCAADGQRVNSLDATYAFGEACLMANDLSAFERPKALPDDLTVAANLLPNMEYASQEDYDRDISRTLFLLRDFAPTLTGTPLPEFAAHIQELLGYKVTEYIDLVIASAMQTIAAVPHDPSTFQLQGLTPRQFSTTSIRPEVAEAFLQSVSATEDFFATELSSGRTAPFDMDVLRARPLLLREDHYVILDALFALEKAGRGVFWSAVKSVSDTHERKQLLDAWGVLFERYVNDMLAASLPAECLLLRDPSFADGAQAFDAAVIEAGTLIVMEHKGGTMSSAAKYADDPVKLGEMLDKRFITGEGKERKGVAQVWNSLKKFVNGEHITSTDGVAIRATDVHTIIPVLVHFDGALRNVGIPHLLAERFRSLGRFKTHSVTPLITLPITELEDLEGHLKERGLVRFLQSFLKVLKSDRAAVFLTSHLPELRGKPRKVGPTLQRFDHYFEEMMARLFPGQTVL